MSCKPRISHRQGIRILGQCAFQGETTAASLEALRCLANALLLVPRTRKMLVDQGHGPQAADKFNVDFPAHVRFQSDADLSKSENIDTEFLLARILFLTTYHTTLDYPFLVTSHALAVNINAAIARHAARYAHKPRRPSQEHTQPIDLMALSETLKLLFNITHFHPKLIPHFSPSIAPLFSILVRRGVTAEPLAAPANFLVNALLNLALETTAAQDDHRDQQQPGTDANPVFPDADPTCNTTHLISLLSASLTTYPASTLDPTVSPLLTLIRRIYDIAPTPVKTNMESLLLPTPADRDKPLGQTPTLASRLLTLTTNALTPDLRGSISALLFELSHKDPATFVANVGYGFASGFLLSHDIAIPNDVTHAHASSSLDALPGVPVNPVTGQRRDREDTVEHATMTPEEKEREAERLFVLFERLKATGVVDVRNPVEEALREGRIQEVSDDEDEDE